MFLKNLLSLFQYDETKDDGSKGIGDKIYHYKNYNDND